MLSRACLILAVGFLAACQAGGAGGGGATPLGGATISRDAGERRLLDACMYSLYAEQGNSSGLVQSCRCAADRAMDALPGEEFALTRSGDLTGEQRGALTAGIQACRRTS